MLGKCLAISCPLKSISIIPYLFSYKTCISSIYMTTNKRAKIALNPSLEFKSSNQKPSAQSFWYPEQTWKSLYYAMLNTKFQASEPSGSETVDFFIFS